MEDLAGGLNRPWPLQSRDQLRIRTLKGADATTCILHRFKPADVDFDLRCPFNDGAYGAGSMIAQLRHASGRRGKVPARVQ